MLCIEESSVRIHPVRHHEDKCFTARRRATEIARLGAASPDRCGACVDLEPPFLAAAFLQAAFDEAGQLIELRIWVPDDAIEFAYAL